MLVTTKACRPCVRVPKNRENLAKALGYTALSRFLRVRVTLRTARPQFSGVICISIRIETLRYTGNRKSAPAWMSDFEFVSQ